MWDSVNKSSLELKNEHKSVKISVVDILFAKLAIPKTTFM